jgi:hypothetical protein
MEDDANDATKPVRSFTYVLPAGSATVTGNSPHIIDGGIIKVGDTLIMDVPTKSSANAGYATFFKASYKVGLVNR